MILKAFLAFNWGNNFR